jgi:hypothetical protein
MFGTKTDALKLEIMEKTSMNAMLALNLQRNLNQHNNGQCANKLRPLTESLVSMIDPSPQTGIDHLVSAELGKMPLKFMLLKGSAPRRRGSRLYIELEWPVTGPFCEKAEDAGRI